MLHFDFLGNNFYQRTPGQIGVTPRLFSDLISFTGPAGRELTDANGDTVTVGINQPRLGNYADLGAGLVNVGWRLNNGDTEAASLDPTALSDALGGVMPSAITIAMSGFITYTDDDNFNQARFVDWSVSGAEAIRQIFETAGTRTGAVTTLQSSSGVNSISASSPTAYSPGSNVPFNIASRHTGTGMRGAVSGVLSTVPASSPITLPNLINAVFQIAPIGDVNLTRLTITADDITDTGIEAATTTGSVFNPLCPFDP